MYSSDQKNVPAYNYYSTILFKKGIWTFLLILTFRHCKIGTTKCLKSEWREEAYTFCNFENTKSEVKLLYIQVSQTYNYFNQPR